MMPKSLFPSHYESMEITYYALIQKDSFHRIMQEHLFLFIKYAHTSCMVCRIFCFITENA